MEDLAEWLTRPEGLATRLRDLRTHARLTGKDLADANGWQQSKVSRIENGKQLPSADDVRAWAATCRADDETADGAVTNELLRLQDEAQVAHATFRSRMRHGQKNVQNDYNRLVAEAHLIQHFETAYVPGLLQVPGYAEAVLREMIGLHDLAIDDVDTAVATRMQRQQMLYDTGKNFEFLLAEPVLRWLICPPEVMRSQLDRLQTLIGLDRVRFGILPMGKQLGTTPQNSFQIYTADTPVAVVEGFIGETWHRGEEADMLTAALKRLWADAVTGESARDLIIAATRELPAS